jgi:serine/threonine-protein kinase RsbW
MSRSIVACDVQLHGVFPADLARVDEFCSVLRSRMAGAGWEHELFTTELVLREILNNAVIHGSRSDPECRVCCAVQIQSDTLSIEVIDEGKGFDRRRRPAPQGPTPAESGRGLSILEAYGCEVQYTPDSGRVSIRRKLQTEPATC